MGGPNQYGPPPPGAPGFGHFPPPPMAGGWGRAGGPGPGPGAAPFGGMQYPPNPQWFPPGQEFPPHMGPGPGPWNNYPYPPGPGGVPPGIPGQPGRQSANHTPINQNQAPKPAPIGPSADKKPATPAQASEASAEPKSGIQQAPKQPAGANAPPPPVDSKPSAEEVKATAANLTNNAASAASQQAAKAIPTGPKSNRPTQILPAVPLPLALTSKVTPTPSKPVGEQSAASTAAALRDATQAARAAVAVAMANMTKAHDAQVAAPPQQQQSTPALDNLTKKVNEMKINATRGGPSNRGAGAGRGRGPRAAKVEVPDSDFDFQSSNAKFNKQEVVKEAVVGSPLAEAPNGDVPSAPESVADTTGSAPPAYNKSKSFFDNISSEAKDRLDNNGQKPGGREWRGEEQRRNIETFGQGSVDGGYRGYRGGRGRGRGGRGRGFRGGGRGGPTTFRPRDAGAQAPAPPQ